VTRCKHHVLAYRASAEGAHAGAGSVDEADRWWVGPRGGFTRPKVEAQVPEQQQARGRQVEAVQRPNRPDRKAEDIERMHQVAEIAEHDVAEAVGGQISGPAGLNQHRKHAGREDDCRDRAGDDRQIHDAPPVRASGFREPAPDLDIWRGQAAAKYMSLIHTLSRMGSIAACAAPGHRAKITIAVLTRQPAKRSSRDVARAAGRCREAEADMIGDFFRDRFLWTPPQCLSPRDGKKIDHE
jgi:hypothetical protein